jgi:NAD-dependent dihydropyrimidine dehydrogenase PreA subunit
MCEYCTKHGEGKKWYLQMKNYSDELLHQELSHVQKKYAEVNTRTERMFRFFKIDVMPAITGMLPKQDQVKDESKSKVQLSEEEIAERRKVLFGQVLPIEDIEQVIDLADSITRFPCGCRFITIGKADKRYCFGLGIDKQDLLGKFPDAASSLEVLSKKEAKKLFREYDNEGLFHTVWTFVAPYIGILCNCDRDCREYKGYIEKMGAPRFFRAEYVCQVDTEKCKGCRSCMKQCQFGSKFYSSVLSKVYIDPTRCFGCGVCRAACPNDAIRLVPREKVPDAANIWLNNQSH